MEIIRDQHGAPIRTSRNLRGILTHARTRIIKRITADPLPNHEGKLCVLFEGGDNYETNFASYEVLLGWLVSRRSWYGAPLTVNGCEVGELNKHAMQSVERVQ